MSAPIKHAVEVHRVELPPRRHGRYIFIQPRDQRDVAGARFSRYSCVGDAEGAVFEDAGAQEGGEGAGDEIRGVGGVRFGEGLEGFICS